MFMPLDQCLGGNLGLIRNIGDRAPGKNGLRQVIKDIGDIGRFVNSMNSPGNAPKVQDREYSWKTVTHTERAMTKQAAASQKLEKLFPG
jgi:hypothetical protein